jgi:ribosomal protein L33
MRIYKYCARCREVIEHKMRSENRDSSKWTRLECSKCGRRAEYKLTAAEIFALLTENEP